MEAVLAMPSADRAQSFILPLSLAGVPVRTLVQTGSQLVAEAGREAVDCILLPETLPDGPADLWLAKVGAVTLQRPVAVILVYGVEGAEAVRERARAAYGPGVEVVAAGARREDEVAAEAARVAERLAHTAREQDREALQRLQQPVASGAVPQPVRKGGAILFVGAAGGVGTSTMVANLAAYTAMAGERVLLVDAQFATGGSLHHYLGTVPDDDRCGMHHLRWSHAAAQGAQRDGAVQDLLGRLQEVRLRGVRHAEIRLLHIPALLEHMVALPVEQLLWALQLLEREFGAVLVDCGTGLGSERTVKLLEQVRRAILVAGGWGASVAALARVLSALEERRSTGITKEALLLCLREAGESAYGPRTVAAAAKLPTFARLPEEPALRQADCRLGHQGPLVVTAPDSPYSAAVAQLAFALGLVAQPKPAPKRGGLWPGWLRFGLRSG